MKRYDIKSYTQTNGKITHANDKEITPQELDELLLAKAEKEVKTIKQRIATRKHRENKNVR